MHFICTLSSGFPDFWGSLEVSVHPHVCHFPFIVVYLKWVFGYKSTGTTENPGFWILTGGGGGEGEEGGGRQHR